ncbi:uncharacterized protein LOC131161440 [Malania oleifera]|uniref:uncharacterized protein LOC131161440 n=1 Tax=Malania oleifera TaxID=397392 RepID=UPI0025AE0302|nr:uncharacterized protein LOC131161440 [Malania oleifera]
MEKDQMGNGEEDQRVEEDDLPLRSRRRRSVSLLWWLIAIAFFVGLAFRNGLQELCHITRSPDTIFILCVVFTCVYAHCHRSRNVSLGGLWRRGAVVVVFLQYLCVIVLRAVPACRRHSLGGEESSRSIIFVLRFLAAAAVLWLFLVAFLIMALVVLLLFQVALFIMGPAAH